MFIPNTLITFVGTNGSGGSRIAPKYVADLLRARWGQRLDSLAIGTIPRGAPDFYREVSGVAEEESIWRGEFRDVFDRVYPEGLRKHIESLLLEDASERAEAARRVLTPEVAHESFLAVGCSREQALALHTAGYPTLADLPDEFLKVAEVKGITPDFALTLIKAKTAKPAKAANPLEAVPAAKK